MRIHRLICQPDLCYTNSIGTRLSITTIKTTTKYEDTNILPQRSKVEEQVETHPSFPNAGLHWLLAAQRPAVRSNQAIYH